MDTVIKWRDSEGQYQTFDNSDIDCLSRNHAIHLFQLGVPVIAKEGDTFFNEQRWYLLAV